MKLLLNEWIINLLGVTFLGVLTDIILPNGDIRKYTRFLIGLVILIIVLQPLLGIFNRMPLIGEQIIQNSAVIDTKKLEYQSQMINQVQTQQLEELFIQNLEYQIESYVKEMKGYTYVKAKAIFSKKKGTYDFSDLKEIRLVISNDAVQNVAPVKVHFGVAEKELGDKLDMNNVFTRDNEEIRLLISNAYNIQKNKIFINQLEEE